MKVTGLGLGQGYSCSGSSDNANDLLQRCSRIRSVIRTTEAWTDSGRHADPCLNSQPCCIYQLCGSMQGLCCAGTRALAAIATVLSSAQLFLCIAWILWASLSQFFIQHFWPSWPDCHKFRFIPTNRLLPQTCQSVSPSVSQSLASINWKMDANQRIISDSDSGTSTRLHTG